MPGDQKTIDIQEGVNQEVEEDPNVTSDEEAEELENALNANASRPPPPESAGNVLLRQSLERILPDLWEYVVKIATGPEVPQNSSPYETTRIVNQYQLTIQDEAARYVNTVLNDLPKEALLALKDKAWVRNRPVAIPINGNGHNPVPEVNAKDVAMVRVPDFDTVDFDKQ